VATDGPNNDGIDPDSCRDVLIEHCTFDTGDDCVVLKSGYNEDGWRVGQPTENVIMRYCSTKRGHGGLVIGSEMSGDVRNVFLHDCQFDGTDHAIRIKSKRGRGGVVEKVYARNLKVKNMKRDVAILNMDYSSDRNQAANEKPPVFRDMQFEDITADGAPVAIVISGLEDSAIENIRFKNWRITSLTGVTANWGKELLFDNVNIIRDVGPVFELKECAGVTVTRSRAAKGTSTFLKLEGASSQGVRLESCNLSEASTKFVTGEGVAEDAVEVK
jgi:polygalacturonase